MIQIDTQIDARYEFSDCLKKVMEKRNLFNINTHGYLVSVMIDYLDWRQRDTDHDEGPARQETKDIFDELRPSINTAETRPFAFQTAGIGEKLAYLTNNTLRAERLRTVAETLLVSVGYWPESLARRTRREQRPPISYYATLGQTTYSKVANIIQTRNIRSTDPKLMQNMAEGFRKYAGVLYHFRHEMGDVPVKNLGVLFEMTNLLKDSSILDRYLLNTDIKKRAEKQQN